MHLHCVPESIVIVPLILSHSLTKSLDRHNKDFLGKLGKKIKSHIRGKIPTQASDFSMATLKGKVIGAKPARSGKGPRVANPKLKGEGNLYLLYLHRTSLKGYVRKYNSISEKCRNSGISLP